MTDIVDRIRSGIKDGWSGDWPCLDGVIAEEAADIIQSQKSIIKDMESALRAILAVSGRRDSVAFNVISDVAKDALSQAERIQSKVEG